MLHTQVCTQTLTSEMSQFALCLPMALWSASLSLQFSVLLLHVLPGRMWEMRSSNTHIKSCRDKVDSITNYSHTAGSAVKTPPADAGDLGLISRVVKIPWTRKWQPAPVFMPGKSHGQRSLVGYGPRGCKRIRHKLVTKYQNQGSLSPIIPSFWALLNMI